MSNPRGQQRDKPFRDALRVEAALAENNELSPAHKGSLRWIARKLLERAGEETAAQREVADRLDGKVPQAMALTDPTGQHDRLAELLGEIDGKTRGLVSAGVAATQNEATDHSED